MSKLITIAALIAPAFTFGFQANDQGIIELDVQVTQRPKKHLTGVAHHLMQLNAATHQDEYIDKQLYDYNNIQIYSTIYIGSEKQKFDMIFDTGSSWVWVGTDKCAECHNPEKFHFDHSTSFIQNSSKISTLRYGRGEVWGYDSHDTICLSEESTIGNGCMENYLFKSVVYQEGLGGLAGAGLIGLAPSSQYAGSQLFVPSLFDKGAIKHNMFSLFID